MFAAPEFSVKPLESCFLFAGCVSYRGFYSEEAAERHAAALVGQGYDVYVGGVAAYSTLGWFSDPVLSTFIQYPEPEVARIVFHELAHQVVYVKGDTMFNESFATAVEDEGVRRWLGREGTPAQRAGYEASGRRRAEFVALMTKSRAERTMRSSLRSRVTRSSCPRFVPCSPKRRATCRPSTPQCASWRSSTNRSAMRAWPSWAAS